MRLRHMLAAATSLFLCAALGAPVAAQGQLAPAITVNSSVISQYELTQRKLLLDLFRTPGDTAAQARDGLIDDRLRQQEMARFGVTLSDAELDEALEEFAGRANMNLAQFTRVLQQNGVAFETLRDFVKTGVSWRDFIRGRYGREVTVSDADVQRALAQRGGSNTAIEVLLSEIILDARPPRAAAAQAEAARISRLTSQSAFEAAARRSSALPSRAQGGRLGWLPITNYPPAIQGLLLDLNVGEVTPPLPITNGIALFQMRGVREVPQAAPAPASIGYAAYYIPGGQTPEARSIAADVAASIDTCDDLFGIARNQPPEVLVRNDSAPADIPDDVALELARLDPGEVSYNLTANNGQTLVFLMLCDRKSAAAVDADPAAVANQIRGQRLSAKADALLADLRSSAVIRNR